MMIDSSTDDEDDEVVDHAPQRNGGPPGKQNGTPGNQKVPNGTSIDTWKVPKSSKAFYDKS